MMEKWTAITILGVWTVTGIIAIFSTDYIALTVICATIASCVIADSSCRKG
ncbi:hypothetical protein ACFL2D_02955 [Patescibacteria group bacterium]